MAPDARRRDRMIINRTPLRVSFVGRETGMAVFYRRYGGALSESNDERQG
jgi:galactokinase/mevalonate kinase-like predicted kinase